jgi:hypothetical protein
LASQSFQNSQPASLFVLGPLLRPQPALPRHYMSPMFWMIKFLPAKSIKA